MELKVLSMTQPWASQFVLGEVKYETRSWRTNYRTVAYWQSRCCWISKDIQRTNLRTCMIMGVCKVNCVKVIENNGTLAILEGTSKWEGALGKLRTCSCWMTLFQRKESMGLWGMNKD
ncbi:hypothetical protein [Peribacillus frigoritolerans]|uniref:hypothetical protein n=1 Tax=Peribacillus frigoritolerans TaxID=450367 RepID=UPI0032E46A0C